MVSVLATCPATKRHAVGSAVVDVCRHDVSIAWVHLRLTNLELAVHVGITSVVPGSQPDQHDLLLSVQFVEAVCLVKVWVLLLPFFLGEVSMIIFSSV